MAMIPAKGGIRACMLDPRLSISRSSAKIYDVVPGKRRSRADPGPIPDPWPDWCAIPVTVPEWIPGLRFASPGTTTRFAATMWVYLLASKKGGTLYVGVTNSLSRRILEHREGRGSEFARQYGVRRLVYAEHFDDQREAIAHEKRIKHWHRRWKVELIEQSNPDWNDLYPTTHLD